MGFLTSIFSNSGQARGYLGGQKSGFEPQEQWITSLFSNFKSTAGVNITEKTALSLSAFYACQKAISESLAILPKHILNKDENDLITEAKDHPSSKIFKKQMNPLMTSCVGFQTLHNHSISSGNAYAEIEFQRGTLRAINLWPIPPNRVETKITETDNELQLLYLVTTPDGSRVAIPQTHMIHLSGFGYDGIKGYNPIDFMADTLGLGKALEEYGSLYFKNGADIKGYFEIPDGYDEAAILNLKKHNEMQSGLQNSHRWKFLYESVKFKPTAAKPEESQMLQSRVFQLQEVARFHRMPLHKIQELTKSVSYNSLEQFNIEFVNDTLMPWIVRTEQEINRKLFTDPKDTNLYIKHNTNSLLRGDSRSRAEFYRTMIFAGVMTQNESRKLEDLPPVEGGDQILTPMNMQSNKSLDAEERVTDQ